MNIMLISQCSKRALVETRRVLDQFAERKGDRTWQTAITFEGLSTLRKLLKKTAKRNTAVACHWIKGANQSELLWVVGSLSAFNERGTVPTNSTERDILRVKDENQWHHAEVIALLAAIAGLFHDFGKANKLFQEKLKPKAKLRSEPYRHEWVSLRLFEAFVGGLTDQQWLQKLSKVSGKDQAPMLETLIRDNPKAGFKNPFKHLPKLAQTVGWLIVSHHRLPKFDGTGDEPKVDYIGEWMAGREFRSSWNSPQCEYETWNEKELNHVWQFDEGTPILSATWRYKAQRIAKRAIEHTGLLEEDWLHDKFTSHLARLSLMLADHCYSASEPIVRWQDPTYKPHANTDRKTKKLKQKLDEHNVGVGHNALLLATSLPKLRQTLPAITRHKGFKQRSKNFKFSWQDKAYDLAVGLRDHSKTQGFFGVNMASTGCGKTFANARIMYGLADEKLGCRFNVALGLRTLTLQTGDALQAKLHLDSDDLAVLIGSQSIRELHELRKTQSLKEKPEIPILSAEQSGSESAAAMFAEHQYIRYDGSLDDGRLSQWLKDSTKLHQLLSAPVLVSTIDHLIPATEGERGGKQIAPMLRLLTSDLVLDEPDDFDLADLPALCRLVNWAGVLGSRVLLSSATLPPALIQALFGAYIAGREVFNRACGIPGSTTSICCGWFDEFSVAQSDHAQAESFSEAHSRYVTKRINKLSTKESLRLAELLPITSPSNKVPDVITAIAQTARAGVHQLHAKHHQVHSPTGKRFSIGLVRMANINPMVAIAQKFLAESPLPNHRIHFCIYHSQHPLIVRSKMEERLDLALTRYDEEALWEVDEFKQAIECFPEENHLFIVFATSVAEVGRDHDYDWAIAEPSSMRSLIQLAGRVQRHRQKIPKLSNLLILQKNYRALRTEKIAYARPGFESIHFELVSKDLADILLPAQYQQISAIPRIRPRDVLDSANNLVDLEHAHLNAKLFGSNKLLVYAGLWWKSHVDWSAEFQRQTPFRKATPDEEFVLYLAEEGEEPQFYLIAETGEVALVDKSRFSHVDMVLAEGVQPWVMNNAGELLENIADRQDISVADASLKFGELRLREKGEKWYFNPLFGTYGALE